MADFPLVSGNTPWALFSQGQEEGMQASELGPNVQYKQAQLPLIQSQAQLMQANAMKAGYEAQRLQVQNDLLRQAMHAQGQPGQGLSGRYDDANEGTDDAAIMQHARAKYNVPDTWTDEERQWLDPRFRAAGIPDMAVDAKARHDSRITTQRAQAQQAASQEYDNVYAVDTSPTPLQTLRSVNKDAADHIEAQARAQGKDPDDLARAYAEKVGNAVHQYSGRETEITDDGIIRDKTTHHQLLDTKQLGISAKQAADLYSKANEMQEYYDENNNLKRVPTYERAGFRSATEYVRAAAGAAAAANQGQGNQAPAPAGGAPPRLMQPSMKAQPNTQQASNPQTQTTAQVAGQTVPAKAPQVPTAPTPGHPEVDQMIDNIPSVYTAPKPGTGLNQNNVAEKQNFLAMAKDGRQKANTAIGRANEDVANIDRIVGILNPPPGQAAPNLGPGSAHYTAFRSFLDNWLGMDTNHEAAGTQILTKLLNGQQLNKTLQDFHGEGAQVRLGAYESRLIMEQLAINPQGTRDAILQMMQWARQDAGYETAKAQATLAGIQKGKAPDDVEAAYSAKFSKSQFVSTEAKEFHDKLKAVESSRTINRGETKSPHPPEIQSILDQYPAKPKPAQ